MLTIWLSLRMKLWFFLSSSEFSTALIKKSSLLRKILIAESGAEKFDAIVDSSALLSFAR